MKRILCLLSLLACLNSIGAAQNSPEAPVDTAKRQKIVELLKLARVADTAGRSLKTSMSTLKKTLPFPPQAQDDFEREFIASVKIDELVATMIPVYEQNYTESEIDQLIAFYKSPIGQTLLEKGPIVTQQVTEKARVVGREIGRRVGEEIGRKIDKGDYGPWQMPGVPKSSSTDNPKPNGPK